MTKLKINLWLIYFNKIIKVNINKVKETNYALIINTRLKKKIFIIIKKFTRSIIILMNNCLLVSIVTKHIVKKIFKCLV